MATLKPFRILRPHFDEARAICTLPYDVMDTAEARRMADGNPLSFLRVTRAEIEFDDSVDPYSDEVYRRGAENLQQLIAQGHLVREDNPVYMIYRLVMGNHTQTGIVAAASCAEYDSGIIKKHELTRPDKEDDRTRHINLLGAQTGSVFLVHEASVEVDRLMQDQASRDPDIDFTADDGIRHSAWVVRDPAALEAIEHAFANIPALYVADGHHRSAAASRVARERATKGSNTGEQPSNYFLTVTFPHDQVQILGYNRAVKDLNGFSEQDLLAKVAEAAEILPSPTGNQPAQKGEATMFLAGRWHLLRWKHNILAGKDTVAGLDVSVLQDHVLSPVLGIGDPRTDKRIRFVGGIRGTAELERLVQSGRYAVAFAMFPTSVEDLMAIADEGGLMPPKSTWFEPKLRDAIAVHLID